MQYIKQAIVVFLVFFVQSAHSAKFDSKTYIDSKEVKEARGKYSMKVKGVGSVYVQSVSTNQTNSTIQNPKSCLIDKASLKQEIARAFKSNGDGGSHKVKTREIKLKGEMQGDQMVCSSGGDNCTVIINVWDPDDARLPE
jgi:hypothetical protein